MRMARNGTPKRDGSGRGRRANKGVLAASGHGKRDGDGTSGGDADGPAEAEV